MMSTNKNNLSREEQLLRDKINEADFAYQEADWNAIESKVSGGSWAKYKTLFKTAAAFVVLSGAVYFLNKETKTDSSQNSDRITATEKTEKKEQPVTVKKQEEKAATIKKESKVQPSSPIEYSKEESIDEGEIAESSKKTAPTKNEEFIEDKLPAEIEETEKSTSENEVENINFDINIEGKLCLGEELRLSAQNNNGQTNSSTLTYRWFINNKRIIQSNAEFNYIFDDAGEYQISLKVRNESGQIVSESSKQIKLNKAEEIDFTYEDLSGIFSDFTAQLKPNPAHLEYQWFVEGKEIQLDENNQYDFRQKGIYSLALVYKNESGCVSEIEKPLQIEDDLGPFQNVINPASETDKNRVFMPHGFENHKGFFELTIFDLSGSVVFKSNSPLKKWDGSLNNSGQKLAEGNYVWTINVANEKGQKRNITDRVKLLYLK